MLRIPGKKSIDDHFDKLNDHKSIKIWPLHKEMAFTFSTSASTIKYSFSFLIPEE